jgi:hypothetical protein
MRCPSSPEAEAANDFQDFFSGTRRGTLTERLPGHAGCAMDVIAQTGTRAAEDQRPLPPRAHLFTVRLWKEEVDGGSEYRGSVRDVACGAFRAFRRWPDLTEFMVARIEECIALETPSEG